MISEHLPTFVNIGLLILTAIVLVFLLIIAWNVISTKYYVPNHKRKNVRAEIRLLKSLIKDIKDNPSHWVSVPHDMSSLREPHLINDKKSMAIMVMGENTILIKINLKSAHKYRENAEETIATPISGRHVEKFLKQSERYIDTRGKELSFIKDMLDKRL